MVAMSNCIYHIDDYKPLAEDKFFFDANIWLSIYGPIGYYADWRVRKYSNFLTILQLKNCYIYTNTIIISEFVNRFARMEFEQRRIQLDLEYDEFKRFREMEDFKEVASEIAANIRKIIRSSNLCNHEISDDELFDLADIYEKGGFDINDLMFEEICKQTDSILVTHDGDFKNSEIKVVTANNNMLRDN